MRGTISKKSGPIRSVKEFMFVIGPSKRIANTTENLESAVIRFGVVYFLKGGYVVESFCRHQVNKIYRSEEGIIH